MFAAGVQRFLRSGCDDEFSGDKRFLYERSVSYHRIEAWRLIILQKKYFKLVD